MYTGRDFSVAEQVESERFGLDFVRDLQAGDTITSAAWTLSVTPGSNGTDPNPMSHLVGSPALATPAGTTRQTATVQRISGLLPDVRYTARAVVGTAQGDTVTLYSHITSVPEE